MILYNLKTKKSTRKRFFCVFILILANFSLNACVSRIEKSGYMFDLSDHELLQEGVFTKSKVLQLMGSPTIISDLDGQETWIYYAQDAKKLLFFKPDIVNREIVTLSFDNADILSKLEKYNIDNEEKLNFSQKYTQVKSRDPGLFKLIFGNIGRVNAQ